MDRDPRKWRRFSLIKRIGALCFVAGMTAYFNTRDEMFIVGAS